MLSTMRYSKGRNTEQQLAKADRAGIWNETFTNAGISARYIDRLAGLSVHRIAGMRLKMLGEHSLGGYRARSPKRLPKLCERLALLTIHAEPADVPAAI